MKNKKWMLLIALIAILIANRIFNHVNAWFGIVIILLAVIFIIYQLIKFLKDETKS